MNFHVFGNESSPVIVLIHGVLTPWQIWGKQIEHFSESYRVIAVALDAHEEERPSEFLSIEDEAEKIEDYIMDNCGGEVFAVCGLSMGGVIAHQIWRNGVIGMKKLIMDGAPLKTIPKIALKIMTSNYLTIIRKSKKRDPKTLENFKKQFLPERFLDSYLKIADNMSDQSVRNIVSAAMSHDLCADIKSDTDVLFIHGTKGNEVISAKVGKLIKKYYPESRVHCFKGYLHCEATIYKPEEWLNVVEELLG
ncbi:MAG: alpha/beta hydrolase [Oscillospiraceae bacterium]|nr:alpha/beta hydrolase [Oscillospiraceae bacterium]